MSLLKLGNGYKGIFHGGSLTFPLYFLQYMALLTLEFNERSNRMQGKNPHLNPTIYNTFF